MLSRRNVRIKVMQMLYALGRDKSLGLPDVMRRYRDSISHSFELYLFYVLYFIRVVEYAEKDAEKRASRHRPTEGDKAFTPRLAQNRLMDSLRQNEGLARLCKLYRLDDKVDVDLVRTLYQDFAKQEAYKAYLLLEAPGHDDHAGQLLELLRQCLNSETLQDAIEDHYPNLTDDESLVIGAMKKTIKALPVGPLFYEEYRPPAEATTEFGEKLLRMVHEEDTALLQIIEPALKNWDAERVAVLDMILLKMALCEFLHFPSIPAKVTLNEFVEISKLYSTEKSKDFINGILDRLMKKLDAEGKIKKEGRGLVEE